MSAIASCPEPELWQAFLKGRLAETKVEALTAHLAACPTCPTQLDSLAKDDNLLAALGSGGHLIAKSDTPLPVAELVAQLKDLIRSPAGPLTPPTRDDIDLPASGFVGRYQVMGAIGVGGMGAVYKGHDPQLDRTVAIKLPRFDGLPAQQARARKRFLREAKAAARVRHDNVCPIYDCGEVDGRPYVVLAYVAGQSLAERLREGGRFEDCREVALLMQRVAEGLDAVHRKGIFHRDVKPGNILLDHDGKPLLTDFGLARITDDREPLTFDGGGILGTPAYMAPEQASRRAGAASAASDIYSLGVVFFQMLTGRLPFEGPAREVLRQLEEDTPPPPSSYRSNLDPALEAIVLKSMAPVAEQRYASATLLAADLERWLKESPTSAADEPIIRSAEKRPGFELPSRWWPHVAVAATLLLVPTLALAMLASAPNAARPTAAAVPPFKGSIDMRVWDPEDDKVPPEGIVFVRRAGLSLHHESALPLHAGDQVRIDVELNRPGYLYVLYLDTKGVVGPVYPWIKGKWDLLPKTEKPQQVLYLPESVTNDRDAKEARRGPLGYKIGRGPPGMDTLLMLVRDEPLPRDFDLKGKLEGLPVQKRLNANSAVWWENGKIVTAAQEPLRGPILFNPEPINDPVLITQEIIQRELRPHFSYIRAVSFANTGN